MLSPHIDVEKADDFFRLCKESLNLFPPLADALLDETGVDIELDQTGTIAVALTDTDADAFQSRLRRQTAAGMDVVPMTRADLAKAEPHLSHSVRLGLYYQEDWQVENRLLLSALLRYAQLHQIRIVENTAVTRVVKSGGRAAGVAAGEQVFDAGVVVLAAGAWSSAIPLPRPIVEVKPIRGQMIAYSTPRPAVRHVVYSPRGYLVPRRDGRTLVGATVEDAGFEKTLTADAVSALREGALEIVPGLAKLDVYDSWAGLRPFVSGGLPVVGPIREFPGLFVATGHYRNGILLAPITAEIAADWVLRGLERESWLTPGLQESASAA
jgi:glycine oxidase